MRFDPTGSPPSKGSEHPHVIGTPRRVTRAHTIRVMTRVLLTRKNRAVLDHDPPGLRRRG